VQGLSTETIAAIDGAIPPGLKGDFAGLSALGANGVEHLASTASTDVPLAGVAAGLATLGLIRETLLRKELLFSGGKSEFLTAVLANDSFVLKHEIPLLN